MHYFTIFDRSGPDLEVVVEILSVDRDFPFLPPGDFLFVLAIINAIWGSFNARIPGICDRII